MKCGAPVGAEEEFCPECQSASHLFRQGIAVFPYTDLWKKSIEKFKYHGCREYGGFYAEAMAAAARPYIALWKPELIVPVPLDRRKERERGFNQAWYLAERIGARTGIPASCHVLKKIRRTRNQKKLGAGERKKNLSGAFAARLPAPGLRILVVDDVYTTGSTMDAVTEALLAAGASGVFFVTFCQSLT